MRKKLTILLTNYNTSHFLELLLYALHSLTKHNFDVLINDNGSSNVQMDKLIKLAQRYDNVMIHFRTSLGETGSQAHGRALDVLMKRVNSEYVVVFDSDAVVLQKDWDQVLLDRLTDRVKIVGTPLGKEFSGGKPSDFPFQFVVMFEMAIFRELGISWQPVVGRDGRVVVEDGIVKDTAWQLREKFLAAGYGGSLLVPKNTRFFSGGPFGSLVGVVEYYTDQDNAKIFATHFGRGHTGGQAKYKDVRYRVPGLGTWLARRKGRIEISHWIRICRRIIAIEVK